MYQTDFLGTHYGAADTGFDAGFASLPVTYGNYLGQDLDEDDEGAGAGGEGYLASVGNFVVALDGGVGRPDGMRNSMLAGAVGAAMNVFSDNGSVVGAIADYLIYKGVYDVAMNLAGQMASTAIDIGGLIRESGGAIGGMVVGFIVRSEAVEERLADVLPDFTVPVLDIPLIGGGGGMFNLMERFDY